MKDIFLIDMDETLLDFPHAERENLRNALTRYGIGFDEARFARFHKINDDLWKLLERGGITREELKLRRFELLFGEFGIHARADEVAKTYFDGFPELCFPYEGAADFLRELASRGRVYIATNGGAHIQRRHIELAGFSPYLTDVFISEEMGADKPSQAFADGAASRIAGFERSRAVWIGDSLTSDMLCAEKMGVDFILYAPKGAPKGYSGRMAGNYGEALALLD